MDLVLFLISLTIIGAAIAVVVVARRNSRDEIFTGITPGQFGSVVSTPTEKIPGGEYRGTIPVQFQPPKEAGPGSDPVGPGLVGAVVGGRVRPVEVTATIIDLAVRGFLEITPLEAKDGGRGKQDWLLTVNPEPPGTPRDFELRLLQELFGPGPRVRMSDLQSGFGLAMRTAQVSLYEQMVRRGWYRKHPRSSGGPAKGWGIALIIGGFLAMLGMANAMEASLRVLPGMAAIIGGIILLVGGRGIRVPRTATGTAVRIQSLGFKEYLVTAEADQIKFEEAADIFSRYLPYAIVFGVADRWAKLFGDIAKKYQHDMGLSDVAMLDLLSDFMWIDFLSGGGLSDGFGEMIGAFDPDVIGETFAGLGEGFGDLGEAMGGLGDALGGLGDALGDLDFDGCGD